MSQVANAPKETVLQALGERTSGLSDHLANVSERIDSLHSKLTGDAPNKAQPKEESKSTFHQLSGQLGSLQDHLALMGVHIISIKETLSELENLI